MNAAVRRRHQETVPIDDFDLTGPAPAAGQVRHLEHIGFPISSKEGTHG